MKCLKCKTDNPPDSKYCKECSAPLTSSADVSDPDTETLEAAKEELTTGTTFARRYKIIEELGKGGMGKVYKAHDTEVREKVALKLIKPDIAEDKKTIERFRKTLEMDPDFRPAHSYLGRTYLGKGMYKEALREYEILNDPTGIGLAYAKMGMTKEAHQVLNELIERSKNIYVSPSRIAFIYFALGDNDTGFGWLEKEYEERGYNMSRLKVHPELDIVRSDPRFKLILKKMNLE